MLDRAVLRTHLAAGNAYVLASRRGRFPVALASALGALLDDPNRARRMGTAARRHAAATFSLDAFGEALRAFLFPARPPSR